MPYDGVRRIRSKTGLANAGICLRTEPPRCPQRPSASPHHRSPANPCGRTAPRRNPVSIVSGRVGAVDVTQLQSRRRGGLCPAGGPLDQGARQRDRVAGLNWLKTATAALLLLMIQTGVRVSELTGLRVGDVHLGAGAHIQVTGKGRKKRATTLTSETVNVMRRWLTERRGQPADPVFPTRQGQPLSRYTVGVVVSKHAATSAASCPSLIAKRVTPHTLRHTNAMLLRAKGVDIATIALWLGHETTQTTHIYEHADPALKEQAIARTAPLGAKPGRYRPPDALLAFLESL